MNIEDILIENSGVKYYLTHDNGGRSFAVFVHPNKVNIYNMNTKNQIFLPNGKDFRYKKLFVGKSELNSMTEFSGGHGRHFNGNSILLDIGGNIYIYIGDEIYAFKTHSKILSYHSPVGNNDVPYPYAIDRAGNVYLMIEKVIFEHQDDKDPYELYYRGNPKPMSKKMKTSLIHKRVM